MAPFAVPSLELQKLQPLVFVDGQVYVPGEQTDGPSLITPTGSRLRLRALCPVDVVEDHCRNEQAPTIIRNAFRAGPEDGGVAARVLDFIHQLVPGFQRWVNKEAITEIPVSACYPEWAVQLPSPRIPQPSVLLLGRFWPLAPSGVRVGFGVIFGETRFCITGDYVSSHSLSLRWQRDCAGILETHKRARVEPRVGHDLDLAIRKFRLQGFLQSGDLVLSGDMADLIAHILPPHFNSTLGKFCDRTLAVCTRYPAPATFPFPGCSLQMLTLHDGRWQSLAIRHSVCLGAAPREGDWTGILLPSLYTAVFLRFAAFRLASNGRFNEYDGDGELSGALRETQSEGAV